MRKPHLSCDELTILLGRPWVRVVDARWPVGDGRAGFDQYRRARIPGAAYLGFDAMRAPDPIIVGRAAEPAVLARTLAGLGIGAGHTVIAYDDNRQFTAARLVWLLRSYGFTRAYRLDGGWPAWVRSGHPVETGPVIHPAHSSRLVRLSRATNTIADIADVVAHQVAGRPIVDCRRDSSWAEDLVIPGATRLPMRVLLDSSGLLLAPQQIRAVAATAGIGPATPAIAYCGATISATAVWLALRSAGIAGVRVYDGAITEWAMNGQPVARLRSAVPP